MSLFRILRLHSGQVLCFGFRNWGIGDFSEKETRLRVMVKAGSGFLICSVSTSELEGHSEGEVIDPVEPIVIHPGIVKLEHTPVCLPVESDSEAGEETGFPVGFLL